MYMGKKPQEKQPADKLLLFGNPDNSELKKKYESMMSRKQNNPFTYMSHWLKYEYQELAAIREALDIRDQIEKRLKEAQAKFNSDAQELRKMELGEYTLKSFYLSRASKEQRIEQVRASLPF